MSKKELSRRRHTVAELLARRNGDVLRAASRFQQVAHVGLNPRVALGLQDQSEVRKRRLHLLQGLVSDYVRQCRHVVAEVRIAQTQSPRHASARR